MASDQDTIDRLNATVEQQNAQLTALNEQLGQASGFRQEALSARERIAELKSSLLDRDNTLISTIRDLSEARSVAASAQSKNDGADEKLAAAVALAAALKILTK